MKLPMPCPHLTPDIWIISIEEFALMPKLPLQIHIEPLLQLLGKIAEQLYYLFYSPFFRTYILIV